MALDLTALNAAAAAIVDDVKVVKATVGDLKTLIASLNEKLAAGSLDQAAVDAATATLNQADADLDVATAPSE